MVAALAVGASLLAVKATRAQNEAEQRERDALTAQKEAEAERKKTAEALEDVLRLADSKTIRDLIGQESRLWPVRPDVAPRMAAWIKEVEAVQGRLPVHEQALERLQRAPTTSETKPWKLETLSTIVSDLERLSADDGLLATVRSRYEAARTLGQRSVEAHAEAWSAATARIKRSPKYTGLEMSPQVGLVPLGPDPRSGLEEFAHLGSGSLPQRGEDGQLAYEEDAAIVLVLIPGGEFLMGAQRQDPEKPNFDPHAGDREPVHRVRLSPYLIAKHECTQAQWATLAGGQKPSRYGPHVDEKRWTLSLRCPVENISWNDCQRWLPRHGLGFPTEAQWEHACRAGTDTPWPSGRGVERLAKAANVADQYLKKNGGGLRWSYESFEDGFAVPCPVGSLAPNAFGLHDCLGNVNEWCIDTWHEYRLEDIAVDPVSSEPAMNRVNRGGSWMNVSAVCRSAQRMGSDPGLLSVYVGVRPARAIDP